MVPVQHTQDMCNVCVICSLGSDSMSSLAFYSPYIFVPNTGKDTACRTLNTVFLRRRIIRRSAVKQPQQTPLGEFIVFA